MTDLFSGDQPDERTDLLNKWKDKTPEEILAAKVESDLYIKTLERQKDELRTDFLKAQEDLQARTNMQDLIDRLNQQHTQKPVLPEGNTEKPATIDPAEIEKIVLNKIEANKLQERETINFNQVQSKLSERFGANAPSILREQANTLGLSPDDVNALARKSPEAFFRLMGLNEPVREPFMSPPRSEQRNDHFAPKVQKRTWNFYQEMKKTNPKLYYDPKTQIQMHKDSAALGDAFEDGDFNF